MNEDLDFKNIIRTIMAACLTTVISASYASSNVPLGVPTDLYRKAVDYGDANAQYEIGMMYSRDGILQRDFKNASLWLRKAAEKGHVKAQSHLGYMYAEPMLHGGGDDLTDKKEAVRWYSKAAKQGDADAEYSLGWMHLHGGVEGVLQDFNVALSLLRKSAEQGHVYAQDAVGKVYAEGLGVQKDYDAALYWYKKAAESGNSFATVNLGTMYLRGKGVQKDYRKALLLFQEASGDFTGAGASYYLGLMYAQGYGVPVNYKEAVSWYRKEIEVNYSSLRKEALQDLGWMYLHGHGVPQNNVLAYMLFNLSASRGSEYAADQRQRLAKLMTAEQISEAQELSANWKWGKLPTITIN